MEEKELNKIVNEIKKDFFLYRNGIITDHLKKIYPAGTLIYGLNVPQLKELSKKYPKDLDLSLILWKEKKIREARLLSIFLMPSENLQAEIAKDLIRDIESVEQAEFLAFKVLRNIPKAHDIFTEIKGEKNLSPLSSYCLEMFQKNLIDEVGL
ncbi:MAG: DNA alkylation repair protein [Muribaculaceae bacterium]|nr:DNA alkylation repair protein [Muribaculaceae bacterium]